MSKKQLLVSSAVQAALLNEFLLGELVTGFWKDQRPVGHGDAWTDVQIVVSTTNVVGPAGGFKPLRFYDFLNPEFTKIHEAKLVSIAKKLKPATTFKSLKKELIELARIIGGRMTDKTQEPARVFRGNNRTDFDVIRTVDRVKVMTAAGAAKALKAAVKTATKKTAVKKPTTAPAVVAKTDAKKPAVTVSKTASGATVRKVAAKKTETATA